MEESSSPPAEDNWKPLPRDLHKPGASVLLSSHRAALWSLVLESRQVPHRRERHSFGWRLLVAADRFDAALWELQTFEKENRGWPPTLPAGDTSDHRLSTLTVLILLATFHNLTYLQIDFLGHSPVDWFTRGNAHAGLIMQGQWWRTVTALTLHTGWPHLLGNLAIGGIFLVRLCQIVGPGLAWFLVLTSGALGNLVNAWLQHPDHRAVGASTAVFSALGIIAAINLVRFRHPLRRRLLLPIAAALGLLAFLGSEGEQTDLGAHLFGTLIGLGLGLLTGFLHGRFGRRGRMFDLFPALAAGALVAGAWYAALFLGG
jgi:membrane associated rhomboid family serine protease